MITEGYKGISEKLNTHKFHNISMDSFYLPNDYVKKNICGEFFTIVLPGFVNPLRTETSNDIYHLSYEILLAKTIMSTLTAFHILYIKYLIGSTIK